MPSSSKQKNSASQPEPVASGYKIPKKETPPSKKLEKSPAEEDGGVAKGSDTKKKEDSIQEKKRPSEKKIHRKQKPEEVPDFLVIDSSIIPKERDPRYLDKGYDYQSKEQWKADYGSIHLRAEISFHAKSFGRVPKFWLRILARKKCAKSFGTEFHAKISGRNSELKFW